ncbi:enoyl-CoA hydratase-related protein [Kineosporia sp. A_224]|uniref:enoyl-CoA hydratase-related protein n=1 Tax=Kineosporia sp. A_224 TaxID=1962180 RepID=UPI000B4B2FB6|nr:enoyl-CoA hydratase-related protein [Kineosporia sp. A_224]
MAEVVAGGFEHVRLVRHGEAGHVVEVVLDRPDALNALSQAFAAELRDAFVAIAANPVVRAVVLSSSQDRAFCVGADLKERNGFTDAQLRGQRVVYRAMARAFLDVPVPVVAAVAGYALGGGLELALLCDLLVADTTAVLGLPEVSVGVVPGLGGTQLLSRRIGLGRASDLILTARRLTAAEADGMGLLSRLAEAGQARTVALDVATTIAGHSPVGVRNAKRAVRLGFDTDLASGLEIEDGAWRATAFSADRAEGVAAFNEKRRPVWPGTP